MMPRINRDVECAVAKAILEQCATLERSGLFRHDLIAGVELVVKKLRDKPVAANN